MNKLMRCTGPDGVTQFGYVYLCPGCGFGHIINVEHPNRVGVQWTFNGNMEKPTFSPSILTNASVRGNRCHCFIRDGMIEFLADCDHILAGKTVEIPDADEWDDDLRGLDGVLLLSQVLAGNRRQLEQAKETP